MKREHGFTVIEIIVVTVFLAAATTLLFIQKNNLSAAQRDTDRKTAVNAMYYNLEEVYYKQNSFYPSTIDSKTLRAMDPKLFTDPDDFTINDEDSNYRYEATNCDNTECKGYTLRADLEKEDDYIITSRNN